MKSLFGFLLLSLSLQLGLPVEAADFNCEVRGDYVLRDDTGKPVKQVSGSYVCEGEKQLRSFYTEGSARAKKDYFRQVQIDGQVYWVSEQGATLGSEVQSTPETSTAAFEFRRFDRSTESVNTAAPATVDVTTPAPELTTFAPEGATKYTVLDNFNIRRSGSSTGDVLYNTSSQKILLLYNADGVLDINSDGYVKAQLDTETVYIHQTALQETQSQEPMPTVTQVTDPVNAPVVPESYGNQPGSYFDQFYKDVYTPETVKAAMQHHIDEAVKAGRITPEQASQITIEDDKYVFNGIATEELPTIPSNVPKFEFLTPGEAAAADKAAAAVPTDQIAPIDNVDVAANATNGSVIQNDTPTLGGSLTQTADGIIISPLDDTGGLDAAPAPRPNGGNYPMPRPANLEQMRSDFAKNRVTQGFSNLPAGNWVKSKVSGNLNMRQSPVDGTVLAQIESGGRLAVIATQEKFGQTWLKVIPFDCASVKPLENSDPNLGTDDYCNSAYWIKANKVEQVAAPTLAEIEARPKPDEYAEAGICQNCSGMGIASLTQEEPGDLGDAILAAAQEEDVASNADELIAKFHAIQAAFYKSTNPSTKKKVGPPPSGGEARERWGRANKAWFIAYIRANMPAEDAAKTILALTAFGEARGEGNDYWSKVGEYGLVISVINNRAATNKRTDNKYGIKATSGMSASEAHANKLMGASLSDSQFSAWNSNDPNLATIMSAGNTTSLKTAFEAVEHYENGGIQLLSRNNQVLGTDARHYFTGAIPWWANVPITGGTEVRGVKVATPGGVIDISHHRLWKGTVL